MQQAKRRRSCRWSLKSDWGGWKEMPLKRHKKYQHQKEKVPPRTRIVGFKVQSDNHYTTGPDTHFLQVVVHVPPAPAPRIDRGTQAARACAEKAGTRPQLARSSFFHRRFFFRSSSSWSLGIVGRAWAKPFSVNVMALSALSVNKEQNCRAAERCETVPRGSVSLSSNTRTLLRRRRRKKTFGDAGDSGLSAMCASSL